MRKEKIDAALLEQSDQFQRAGQKPVAQVECAIHIQEKTADVVELLCHNSQPFVSLVIWVKHRCSDDKRIASGIGQGVRLIVRRLGVSRRRTGRERGDKRSRQNDYSIIWQGFEENSC